MKYFIKTFISVSAFTMCFSLMSCGETPSDSNSEKAIINNAINSSNVTFDFIKNSETICSIYLDNQKMLEVISGRDYSNYNEIYHGTEYMYNRHDGSNWNYLYSSVAKIEKYTIVNLRNEYAFPYILRYTDLNKLEKKDGKYYFSDFNYSEIYSNFFERYSQLEEELNNTIDLCDEETYIEFTINENNILTSMKAYFLSLSVVSTDKGPQVNSYLELLEINLYNYGTTMVNRPSGVDVDSRS